MLVGGAVAVVLAAGGVVLFVPGLPGSPSTGDPGCAAYTGTALVSYNEAISDLNAQAAQATQARDAAAAITSLKNAAARARSATVKSALRRLLTELTRVAADSRKGSVPVPTVSALNAAAKAADSAC